MKVGIVGFSNSGKTTLLHAVSGSHRSGDVAAVPVPDPRFDRICEAVKPKKRVPATVEIIDNAATLRDSGAQAGFAEAARRVDVLLHVAREFDSPMAPFHADPNPARDQDALETELVLADLGIVENRLLKLTKSHGAKQPGHADYLEKQVFEKIKPDLEDGTPIRRMDLTEEEMERLSGYQMLTAKPMVVAINCAESAIKDSVEGWKEPTFRICAEIEKEITQLEPGERAEFLADLGIEKPASEAMVRAAYSALGLITFFTAGENITQAWSLRGGSTALKAADTIHTDIAKGFIRAEITHYADFERVGDVKACYSQGLMKLEGKEYQVQDGDIINIRTSR